MRGIGLLEYVVCGIPCTIRVDTFTYVEPWKGSPMTCPSADDFYGYTDVEFTVCDRNGREADWLERKMDDDDRDDVEQFILEEAQNWDM